jgi:3-isopropylmalate/(R)-2-methylmalate dehydratase small subunit
MQTFNILTANCLALLENNINTDQIIPARFLKGTDRLGMGSHLFADWRNLADGSPDPEFSLNQPLMETARFLLVGRNFGCGSSREHAVWALSGAGFRAVISTSFADIFRNNALKNGLLPITVDDTTHKKLAELAQHHSPFEITVNLVDQTLSYPGGLTSFPVEPFNKTCLLQGVDELGYLLGFDQEIGAFENRR